VSIKSAQVATLLPATVTTGLMAGVFGLCRAHLRGLDNPDGPIVV
jgi:hypothetical protein